MIKNYLKHVASVAAVACGAALLAGLGVAMSATAAAATSDACAPPDPALLRTTWQAFRSATLAGAPASVARFYQFPVKLLPPMDGDRPLAISRAAFIKNYRLLFQQGPADSEIGLLTEMKHGEDSDYIPAVKFDAVRCAYAGPTRIASYNFVYDKKAGWQVASIFYGEDYAIAKDAGVDR